MTSLTISPATEQNLDAAVALRLASGQERSAAPVVASLAQALVTTTAWPSVVKEG